MAIDNVYDAIDKQYPKDDGIPSAIMKVLDTGKALGKVSPPIYGFFAFLNSMSSKARQERAEAFVRQLVEDMGKVQDAMEKMRTIFKKYRRQHAYRSNTTPRNSTTKSAVATSPSSLRRLRA